MCCRNRNLTKKSAKPRKGFTLSELLVVIIVIAVLGAIAVPVYTKAIKRSRASDALKVLSLASAKQEVYLINHDKYAANFTDLSAPVKGLTGTGGVSLGHFKYTMDKNCIIAERASDKYAIIKNFDTQEEGCIGDGCKYIQGLVPTAGAVGCDISDFGIGDGTGGGTDPCIDNPDLCKGPGGVTCPVGKIYSPALNSCICAISSCGANGVLNPNTCTCSCSGTCVGGKVMSDTCECECPSDKPYFYNNQCSVCPSGAPKADGSCCAANQCYDGVKCINKLVPDGTTTETMACGKTGTQTRTFNEGCPGNWGPWSVCKCPNGQVLKDGVCSSECDVTTLCPGVTEQRRSCGDGYGYQVRKPDAAKCPEGWGAWSACACYDGYIWNGMTCALSLVVKPSCSLVNKPVATQNCGNCGTQTRSVTCDTGSGLWMVGGWGSCTGQGACAPGALKFETCTSGGKSGSMTSTCSDSCAWVAGTCLVLVGDPSSCPISSCPAGEHMVNKNTSKCCCEFNNCGPTGRGDEHGACKCISYGTDEGLFIP